MKYKSLTSTYSVTPQIAVSDIPEIASFGFKAIISNRPDNEEPAQPLFEEIARAAKAAGLEARHIPFTSGKLSEQSIDLFRAEEKSLPGPILAFCRSGKRSEEIFNAAKSGLKPSRDPEHAPDLRAPSTRHDVVILGGGSAGIAVASSLLARCKNLDIAIIEPSEHHFYQPGYTLVGRGIFSQSDTVRSMASVMPRVKWIKTSVKSIEPRQSTITTIEDQKLGYGALIVCPGLKLDWQSVNGLEETLGKNGVTSNYRYDLAPYTWKLVQGLTRGRALFTQPLMPIKCAGAPQKALYLSADFWLRQKTLPNIDIAFYNAGAVLFGVADYVPALMEYVKRYDASLNFSHNLIAVDGPGRKAIFRHSNGDGVVKEVETGFDLLHVCPPQTAHDFVKHSELGDAGGWVDVDPATLRHKRFENIFGLGDATNTPNAKTVAAVRKQAPVVAENLLQSLGRGGSRAFYDGYGACPLTVENGKVVLAEFAYGGKVAPTFPDWMIDGTRPSRAAWFLKKTMLPAIYWNMVLKGHEWLAKPKSEL